MATQANQCILAPMFTKNPQRIAVIGAGPAGLFCAQILASRGHKVSLFESHGKPGGCASFFRKKSATESFSFDAGATVLNYFSPGEAMDKLCSSFGVRLPPFQKNSFVDFSVRGRVFRLNVSDAQAYIQSLEKAFPQDANIIAKEFPVMISRARRFGKLLQSGVTLPLQNAADIVRALKILPQLAADLPFLLGNFSSNFEAWLREKKFSEEFLEWAEMNLLITLQCRAREAHPLWAQLGLCFYLLDSGTLEGGMRSLFEALLENFRLKGDLHMKEAVTKICDDEGAAGKSLCVESAIQSYGPYDYVISCIPRFNTQKLYPTNKLFSVNWDYSQLKEKLWGANIAYVGLKDSEDLPAEAFNFHSRIMRENGEASEAYLSFSARNDLIRAPAGFRTLTMSEHTNLGEWEKFAQAPFGFKRSSQPDASLQMSEYLGAKKNAGEELMRHLNQNFPRVEVVLKEFGTPKSFFRYTRREGGSVGGIPLSHEFLLQNAPSSLTAHPRIFQIGDTSFPGQSVYACAMGAQALVLRLGL